jgi:hypothetical protein
MTTQTEYAKLSESEKKKEDWMNSKWRPLMGYVYMGTCIFDFIIAPILWSLVQAFYKGGVNLQWQPLTLQGAGLFHISMGAVLGLAAYGRTQEKLNGANNGGIALPANVGTTYTPPAATPTSPTAGFGAPTATTVTQTFGTPGFSSAPATNSWGSQPLGGNSANSFDSGLTVGPSNSQQFGAGGKPLGPPPAAFPAI